MAVELAHFIELEVFTLTDHSFYVTDEKQSGEYRNALVLNTRVANDTLFVTDPLNPVFNFPQDKLSAHKITDTKAILKLPENKKLFLNLADSNLKLKGNYKNILLNIHKGNVVFKEVSGSIDIININADITTKYLTNYFFEGFSRNGKFKFSKINRDAPYHLKVESINGDIILN